MIISGIYKITNLANSKFYIGSTTDFKRRKRFHLRDLNNNNHCNSYLQRSFNKYGKENFTFELIEECSKDILLNREQYYLDTLNPNYNMYKKAGSVLGIKRSDSTKLKMRNSQLGKKATVEARLKMSNARIGRFKGKESGIARCILQYDINNNIIKEHDSINLARLELNISRTGINNCLNGRSKSSGGFIWKYKEENINGK